MRPHQHAVAAGLIHRLDHQLVQVLQNIFTLGFIPANVSGHVGQNGLLIEVVADDLRHESIDGLVVGDARAGRVGDGDFSGAVNLHDAGNAEGGVRLENLGVNVIIVHPAVNDVHFLVTLGGAHDHVTVNDRQVPALHQLGAHLLG